MFINYPLKTEPFYNGFNILQSITVKPHKIFVVDYNFAINTLSLNVAKPY